MPTFKTYCFWGSLHLELVNDKNELTGDLILVQLKSRENIPWTKDQSFILTGINIATTNYWYNFPVPVFIFLTDIENQELYFLPVHRYIKKHYSEFDKQEVFNYKIEKKSKFGIFSFRYRYLVERYRQQFENEFLFFLSNLKHFQDFQTEHDNLDFHLGVEDEDLIFFEAMHRNYEFLCSYLDIKNPVPSMIEIKRRSREKFKSGFYNLYEHDLTELVGLFKTLTLEIVKKIKLFLNEELSYWSFTNRTVYNYVRKIKDSGEVADY